MASARSTGASLLAALLLASLPARSDDAPDSHPAPQFGDRGIIAFGGDFGFGSYQALQPSYDSIFTVDFDPSIDFFVARRLSLGLSVAFSYTIATETPGTSDVTTSPRVGYALPLGRHFALWPRLAMGFEFGTQGASPSGAFHDRILSTTLLAPVDAFLLPHVAIGVGPAVTQELLHRTDAGTAPVTTTFQLLVELTGWL